MLQNVQRCNKITTVPPPQNQERKHRTFVYVLIVTEVLEDWEDSVNIGKALLVQNGNIGRRWGVELIGVLYRIFHTVGRSGF